MEDNNDNDKITSEMIRELLVTMKLALPEMLKAFGIGHLVYNEKQMEVIEHLIDDKFPQGHSPMPTTLIPFAFYLGECIIRNVPDSAWDVDSNAEGLHDMRVRVRKGHYVYPFSRTMKYWKDRTDRMSTMLRMTVYMNEVDLKPEYMKKRIGRDGWIQTFYGDCYRVMIGDPATKARVEGKSYMEAMDEIGKRDDEKSR